MSKPTQLNCSQSRINGSELTSLGWSDNSFVRFGGSKKSRFGMVLEFLFYCDAAHEVV